MKTSERLSIIRETAIAVSHAVNNPLLPIMLHTEFLLRNDTSLDESTRARLQSILHNALQIREFTRKLVHVKNPKTTEYVKGTRMLDVEASVVDT
jgi:hypothetical protein